MCAHGSWEQTEHPTLKLDLDISHFVVKGNEMVHSVNLCAPYSPTAHIKDGVKIDGQVQFCEPGDGDIDIAGFLLAWLFEQAFLTGYSN
jgi:sugar phosphate isomerase/epimerase